jgi:hypothetical protein
VGTKYRATQSRLKARARIRSRDQNVFLFMRTSGDELSNEKRDVLSKTPLKIELELVS